MKCPAAYRDVGEGKGQILVDAMDLIFFNEISLYFPYYSAWQKLYSIVASRWTSRTISQNEDEEDLQHRLNDVSISYTHTHHIDTSFFYKAKTSIFQ